MQHVEFFHKEHFENKYHRVAPAESLKSFIDFFWETDFDTLWEKYPKGFSDALFPNTGYTYLINLANPFTMQVGENKFEMRTDGFLPRHKAIECFHQPGNKLFGIKFRVSPVLLEKKANFGEYRDFIFPLSYLVDPKVIAAIKKAASFKERVALLNQYFEQLVKSYPGSLKPVETVTAILDYCDLNNDFAHPVEDFAKRYGISARTLQRYFETATSLSSKKVLQIMRIRKAVAHIAESPGTFRYSDYGYYDQSHFYKHLMQFLEKKTLKRLQLHLKLLELLHK